MAKRVLQEHPVQAQDDDRALDVPRQVGDPLPAICGVRDVARVFRVGVSQVHRLRRQGRLAPFILPGLGKARYSGKRLLEYERGELDSFVNGDMRKPRVFGRKAS